MARSKNKQPSTKQDRATASYQKGAALLAAHPLFAAIESRVSIYRNKDNNPCPQDGWAVVTKKGAIYVHPTRLADPQEWLYMLAHCLLHLGFGHFRDDPSPEWNCACDCFAARFLAHLKLGRAPSEMSGSIDFSAASEQALYRQFLAQGVPPALRRFSTAGKQSDMLRQSDTADDHHDYYTQYSQSDWQKLFSQGLSTAVSDVVAQAGSTARTSDERKKLTVAQQAKRWFIASYPLLGALATGFTLIEDFRLCQRMDIQVAAVNPELKEMYLNPTAGLDANETRFVIAHELLHVGLRHQARRQGRDAYLWNIACDYVINGWLIEMQVGHPPSFGLLHDPELKGLSAETLYDRIVTDMRRFRKLSTLRGRGVGDILEGRPEWWSLGAGLTLDEFYRRALSEGFNYHESHQRGFLPAGLVEEIRALNQPVIPWDVELARWFDRHFSPIEFRRTYARPSRRQSSTPDIPRPRWVINAEIQDNRTFGVILDTSGSMDRNLLAKALGTIASYSVARDVIRVRVVFCDATHYDQGYLSPDDIAGSVKVRGRGGTFIQPAITLLEQAEDFPKDGPLLVITDGYCDRLKIHREHAFILPEGRYLPFAPKGPVFFIK